ncbi:MAG: VWA domain-containing protein [Planctomycetia bacterium]|nr:VWA domain-containing protein [Planctomycetia bacterium]
MKGTLPIWLERFLGLDAAESGEGTIWRLDYHWPLAPWLTLVAAAVLAALIALFYLREAGAARRTVRLALVAMRLSLVGILCFMIAQFALSLERTGLPYLVFAVDDSASMGTEDRYDDAQIRSAAQQQARAGGFDTATRLHLAKSLLLADDGELVRDAARRYKVRLYTLSDAARGEPGEPRELLDRLRQLEPNGQTSRLGQGIRSILNDLRGAPPSAIVLFTDGINTEGESLADAAAYARRKGVPLFTVGLGNERPNRDLVVSDLLVDDVVFVDDVVNFEFKLTGHGFEQKRVDVVLHVKNDPAPLSKTTVVVGPDGESQKVRISYRPTVVGDFDYVVEVPSRPEESQADNNQQERVVSVRKEQIRVLLVQSYPSYEFRYLKHLLERDTTIKLSTLLQEADPGYAEIDQSALRSFPVRREELFAYDVLIFGDVNPTFLGRGVMRNVADFVTEKGGGLVCIAGRRFMPAAYRDTPLASLLPVEFDGASAGQPIVGRAEGFQVSPTDLGLASPTMQLGDSLEQTREIWSNLPPMYWMFEVAKLKPAVRVLAEHPSRSGGDGEKLPLVSLQYVGAGKVLFHAVDGTWRWRYRVGDVFLARYWVQTVRYLSRAKLLGKDRTAELSTDRREYRRGEPVKLRVRFTDERLAPAEDDGVAVVLEQEGRNNQRLQLRRLSSGRGVFEGVFSDLPQGRYHAWIAAPALTGGAPAADFLVTAAPGEFERIEMDAAELQRASAETKGRYFTLATARDLKRSLPEGRQVPIETLQPVVLWDKWPLLALFLALLAGEWVLRKRHAMV